MLVPAAVQTCLAGEPTVGGVDTAFPFLTTDGDGFPHVCLLSRAELDADDEAIRVVVYSTHTAQNLDRDGRASLIVVDTGAAHYCTLLVARRVNEGRLMAYSLRLHAHKIDEVPGCELTGMTYAVTDEMPTFEDWDGSRRLLALLR